MKKTATALLLTLSLGALPSFAGVTPNDQEVAKYIQAMKLLGTDGSIGFSSGWEKKGFLKKSNETLIKEVKEIAADYESSFDNKIMESKLTIEEKDVCEQYVIYKTEEERYNYAKKSSTSNRNLNFGLSTAAAATAAGLMGLGGVVGAAGLGAAGLASVGGAIGGFFQTDLNYRSRQMKSSENVDYYYVRNGITCGTYAKYTRAVITLTPDVFSLHPQQSAKLIYNSVEEKIASIAKVATVLNQAVISIIDNPFYDDARFKESFSGFLVTDLLYNGGFQYLEPGLDALAKDFSEQIGSVQRTLKNLKANSIIAANFPDKITEIETIMEELTSNLASLERTTLSLSFKGVKKTLLNSNQIARIGGVKLSNVIINDSWVNPSPEQLLANVFDKLRSQDRLVIDPVEVTTYIRSTPYTEYLKNTEADLIKLGFSKTGILGVYDRDPQSYKRREFYVYGSEDYTMGLTPKSTDYHLMMIKKGCILSMTSGGGMSLEYLCASPALREITKRILYNL